MGIRIGSSSTVRCRRPGSVLPLNSSPDAAKALLATKMLGKMPAGSEVIAKPANLSILLALYHSLKNDSEATTEALRCIANSLLLIDSARPTFVGQDVGGGKFAIDLMDVRLVCVETIFFATYLRAPESDDTRPNLPCVENFVSLHRLFYVWAFHTIIGGRESEVVGNGRGYHRREARPAHNQCPFWNQDGSRSHDRYS